MKDVLLLRLNHPSHKIKQANEKEQTAYSRCRVLTLPEGMMRRPWRDFKLDMAQWIVNEMACINNIEHADPMLMFNIAICVAINYGFNQRKREKYLAVWFDDVILDPSCLAHCLETFHYRPQIDALGLPYEGRFKRVFARFFIYKMKHWKRIAWSTLWNKNHYPMLYIIFQELLRIEKGLITEFVDRRGNFLHPSLAPKFLMENRKELGGVVL